MPRQMTGRLLLIAMLGAAAAGCAAKSGTTPESAAAGGTAMPADLAADVRHAEVWGSALYDSYQANQAPESDAVKTAIETARASVRDDCAPDYRTVAVSPPGAPTDRIFLYHIGEVPDSQGIMLGRHYRIETSIDGKGIMLGEPSSPNCTILPPSTDATAPSPIAHAQSRTPDEFDVFLSLRYKRPLRVTTDSGSWRVENGKITFLGRS